MVGGNPVGSAYARLIRGSVMVTPVPSSMALLKARNPSRLSILSRLALVSMVWFFSSMSNHGDMDNTAPGSGAPLRFKVSARLTA